MTFFERQQAARRKTTYLAILMLLAVLCIVLAVNALFALTVAMNEETGMSFADWFQSPGAIAVALITIVVIVGGSVFTTLRLRGGGKVIAEMAGGVLVPSDTQDPKLKRLLNILEEMSIASGTPRPALYLMPGEAGINAFVAGTRPTEAVMAVTQGSLDQLNREQLQGVVGHEYSHILNGDMRLNVRLIGILAGILLIGQAGRALMDSSSRRFRGGGKDRGQAVMFGLGLFAIGYIGIFFGNLIKAAVSRQREFLADAASVQFTRNPDAIAGALWKIGSHTEGSLLHSGREEDLSHLCFGQPMKQKFASLLATHPPIPARIKAIRPGFVPEPEAPDPVRDAPAPEPEKPAASGSEFVSFAAAAAMGTLSAAEVMSRVGTVRAEDTERATEMLHGIPSALREAARSPDGARAVVYALLLPPAEDPDHAKAMNILVAGESDGLARRLAPLQQALKRLQPSARLPLINLCIPALKEISADQRKRFLASSLAIIRVDQELSLSEFALHTILWEHLGRDAEREVRVRYQHYHQLRDAIATLLAMVVRAGSDDPEEQQEVYARSMKHYADSNSSLQFPATAEPEQLREALHKINQLTPMRKEALLASCADCIIHDGKITAEEAELLQAIALCLDCPMPPLA